ncbi:MAG: carbohydrate binding family 9 domain-containing protein, partial [Cyclobacteriaceae bacterium]|nr:carbohydrate binding family 9 domain-containing protein [Cyclobacteriaceae bacterium]
MRAAIILVFVFVPFILYAQNMPGTALHIKKAKAEIILDGKLDEDDWKTAQVAKDWFLNFPVDTTESPFQTEARVTFDDQYFYVSFVCMDDNTPDLINSLRRDFDFPLNDNVGVNIGPFNDGLNGFFFAVTPAGVQREGIISGGGAGGDAFNSFWDNKWYSKVARYDDRWIAEFAIPWKSIRYKKGLKEWNILFDRSDKKRNLRSSWIRTPIQFMTGMFAYSGKLIWDDPVPPPHPNISFIPYIAGSTSKDSEATPQQTSSDLQAGFDAKVGITPSLNLDLTYNPDFSQVEVDQQVINLTRFEFRFPERRQFFLENSDLFSRAGLPEARPFFSRRVGLVRDSSGLYRKVPIVFGARLSGSLNENWRLSVMNMQTKKELELGLPAQNYTVATVQRNFWRQSSFAVTFVNKESLNVGDGDSELYFHESIFKPTTIGGDTVLQKNAFNRVIDFDLEMLSPDNKWHSSSFVAKS